MNPNKLREYEELSSGKTIIRRFDDNDGSLLEETQGYGIPEIAIKCSFCKGVKTDELYFAKRRMVSRRTYEKARVDYADMPPADGTIEDWGAELLRGMAEERQQHRTEASKHIPDPDKAQKSDAFCTSMMERGKCNEVRKWIKTKNHTLGEQDWSGSRNLVRRLDSLGCLNIYACEIHADEDGRENTGHLVIELPKTQPERKKVLKKIDSLAREQGYEGPQDDGQRYAYVGLD
jgi:hypothetical protein